ncbi:hypothetical protein R69658_05417 [Paraburkholderia aspalathi]|uniref:PRTRC system protein E n=2 Tax=Paraburkholderia aspalathi TaxID=1324617 RepID=A0ABN7MNH0_9BURK|nr:PRTRC system protein E [Paraburkholderia aspalathi]MBK3833604.1 PRTRC system protein E [Paraburkholderia aspalathi]CAE6811322.1 hypothetical protein R69658_05417 [Paraburkholderia aspalathi]
MSLFASLYPLAQKTTLTLLITTEGDQLRVNVTPHARDDAKGEKTLYPLSILAAPDELDRDFAEAVAIYEPSTQSVLDQARAASAANGSTKHSPCIACAYRQGQSWPQGAQRIKRRRRCEAAAGAGRCHPTGRSSGRPAPNLDSRHRYRRRQSGQRNSATAGQ